MTDAVNQYRLLRKDYKPKGGILDDDEPRVASIKRIIETKLTQADRTIMLLYVDCMSYRKLGRMLHLSHVTARTEVLRIKKMILEEYDKGRDTE